MLGLQKVIVELIVPRTYLDYRSVIVEVSAWHEYLR